MKATITATLATLALGGQVAAQTAPNVPERPEDIVAWVISDMTCRDMVAIDATAAKNRASPEALAFYVALMYVQGFADARGESSADMGMIGMLTCLRDLDRRYLGAILNQ